ncbi:MAG: chloride channel protein [Flavobacteriales bacterium]
MLALLCLAIAAMAGSASAFLLLGLEQAAEFRTENLWVVWLLPIAGFVSGWLYLHFGKEAEKGNNLVIQAYHKPKKKVPLVMAPLVFVGTLLTHFFGGSAGREGSAVQMSAALADVFLKPIKHFNIDRRLLLHLGVAAGFSSVFGTPLAGALFCFEFSKIKSWNYRFVLPVLITSFLADYTCLLWGASHSKYVIDLVPELTMSTGFWIIFAGLCFGQASRLFTCSVDFCSKQFKAFLSYPPLRLVFGGLLLASIFYFLGGEKFMGLGLNTISTSFQSPLPSYDFALKIALTALTLGAGFKGGEVTPLFFIGACLGNALIFIVPLPLALLAATGFVAVFAGAAKTPFACMLMGLELFGVEALAYLVLACLVAYFSSGKNGIYKAQLSL